MDCTCTRKPAAVQGAYWVTLRVLGWGTLQQGSDDDDDDLFEAPVSMLPMLMAHKKKKKWTSIYKFVKTPEVRSLQVLKQMCLQATAKRQFGLTLPLHTQSSHPVDCTRTCTCMGVGALTG